MGNEYTVIRAEVAGRWHRLFRDVNFVADCSCTDDRHLPRDWTFPNTLNALEAALKQAQERIEELKAKEAATFKAAVDATNEADVLVKELQDEVRRLREERDAIQHQEIAAAQAEYNAIRERYDSLSTLAEGLATAGNSLGKRLSTYQPTSSELPRLYRDSEALQEWLTALAAYQEHMKGKE